MLLVVCAAMQVLCMPFGQQQMVMTRLYSYIVSVKPQVRDRGCKFPTR